MRLFNIGKVSGALDKCFRSYARFSADRVNPISSNNTFLGFHRGFGIHQPYQKRTLECLSPFFSVPCYIYRQPNSKMTSFLLQNFRAGSRSKLRGGSSKFRRSQKIKGDISAHLFPRAPSTLYFFLNDCDGHTVKVIHSQDMLMKWN